ncbi:hypothetical protein H632_c2625p0, partial [Helicosporidium sp. ATCC 50920]
GQGQGDGSFGYGPGAVNVPMLMPNTMVPLVPVQLPNGQVGYMVQPGAMGAMPGMAGGGMMMPGSGGPGMSTFVTKGGLYDRAKKKFRLADGKTLFTYQFFDKNRAAAQAFFADIWQEAQRAH